MKKNKRGKPKRKPPPKMVIRRNAAPRPAKPRAKPTRRKTSPPRQPIGYRVNQMGGSHVAVGIGAGALSNVLGVVAVGKGWIGPKATAGVLMGTGGATAAAGYYWDADHVMAVGVGMAAAGAFSMANVFAVEAYEAAEKKQRDKRLKDKKAEEGKQAAQAQAQAAQAAQAAQGGEPRNAPVFHLVNTDDRPDYEPPDEFDEFEDEDDDDRDEDDDNVDGDDNDRDELRDEDDQDDDDEGDEAAA